MDTPEIIVTILGLITGILNLVAVILPFFSNKSNNSSPVIQVNGNSNSIKQGNHKTKINLNLTINKTDNRSIVTSKGAESKESNTPFIFIAVILLLAFIARILNSLICAVWILLIISSLLSIYICYRNHRNEILNTLGFTKVKQIGFLVTPVFISVLFLIQHIDFLRNADIKDFVALTQAGTSIISAFLGIFFLMLSQISILILTHIKNNAFEKFFNKASMMWPLGIVVCMLPLILFLI